MISGVELVQELGRNGNAKGGCQALQLSHIVVGDRLVKNCAAGHGSDLYVDLCALFNGVSQAKGFIKISSSAENTVLSPNNNVIALDFFSGCNCDLSAAAYHPRNYTNAVAEYDGTLGHVSPKRLRKSLIGERKHAAQCDHVNGMAMVDYAVLAVSCVLLYLVVHQVSRKLTGGLAAANQSPNDAVVFAFSVDLDNAAVLCCP